MWGGSVATLSQAEGSSACSYSFIDTHGDLSARLPGEVPLAQSDPEAPFLDSFHGANHKDDGAPPLRPAPVAVRRATHQTPGSGAATAGRRIAALQLRDKSSRNILRSLSYGDLTTLSYADVPVPDLAASLTTPPGPIDTCLAGVGDAMQALLLGEARPALLSLRDPRAAEMLKAFVPRNFHRSARAAKATVVTPAASADGTSLIRQPPVVPYVPDASPVSTSGHVNSDVLLQYSQWWWDRATVESVLSEARRSSRQGTSATQSQSFDSHVSAKRSPRDTSNSAGLSNDRRLHVSSHSTAVSSSQGSNVGGLPHPPRVRQAAVQPRRGHVSPGRFSSDAQTAAAPRSTIASARARRLRVSHVIDVVPAGGSASDAHSAESPLRSSCRIPTAPLVAGPASPRTPSAHPGSPRGWNRPPEDGVPGRSSGSPRGPRPFVEVLSPLSPLALANQAASHDSGSMRGSEIAGQQSSGPSSGSPVSRRGGSAVSASRLHLLSGATAGRRSIAAERPEKSLLFTPHHVLARAPPEERHPQQHRPRLCLPAFAYCDGEQQTEGPRGQQRNTAAAAVVSGHSLASSSQHDGAGLPAIRIGPGWQTTDSASYSAQTADDRNALSYPAVTAPRAGSVKSGRGPAVVPAPLRCSLRTAFSKDGTTSQ